MKTAALYGGIIAFANAVLMILLFFFGFHNNPDKFLLGMIIGFLAVIVITIIGLVLGIRAIREEKGPGKFTYGQALIAGLLVTAFCTIFGTAFQVSYTKLINPNYNEAAAEWAQSMMEKSKMPSDEIERKIDEMRIKSGVGYQIRNGLIGGLIMGGIFSLITAAFLKRPEPEKLA